jgi:hypothetical protein
MFWEKKFATQKKQKQKLWFGPHAKTPKRAKKKTKRN